VLTAFGLHAYKETVILLSFSFVGLKCSFHLVSDLFRVKLYGNKPSFLCQVKKEAYIKGEKFDSCPIIKYNNQTPWIH